MIGDAVKLAKIESLELTVEELAQILLTLD